MKSVNIQEAKTHLSKYVREIKSGKSILLCERNVPVAEIRPVGRRHPFDSTKIGNARGSILFMSKHFNDPLEGEELASFEDAPL